jgi:hypothetical protein
MEQLCSNDVYPWVETEWHVRRLVTPIENQDLGTWEDVCNAGLGDSIGNEILDVSEVEKNYGKTFLLLERSECSVPMQSTL